MRLRVSTGDEWPGGSGVFQITFLLGPNSSGRPVDAETPVPFGPRNCDHSWATALVESSKAIEAAINGAIDTAKIVFLTFDMTRAGKAGAILVERSVNETQESADYAHFADEVRRKHTTDNLAVSSGLILRVGQNRLAHIS